MSELPAAAGWTPLVGSVLSLAGSALFFVAALGLWRFGDLYTRLHAPAKAATLGVILLAAGSLTAHVSAGTWLWLEDLAIVAFIALTVPIGAQVIARAALRRGVPAADATGGSPARRERPDQERPAR